jgi:redox-sensitive bicupin YhaK (pirin superfamily)
MNTDQQTNDATGPIETRIVPRTRDLGGGFQVRRALPAAWRQMIGPFIFFDQMGPTVLREGAGLDVRPHPHIGLATVTYLFEGEIMHRDSLGSVQPIRAGEVNWMIAGSGIVHSERTPPELRQSESRLSGIQTWVALPKSAEENAPAFYHHGADELPVIEDSGRRVRLIAGTLCGKRSPVAVMSSLFYADAALEPGARFALPPEHEERGAYIVSGALKLDGYGSTFEAGQLLVFRPGVEVILQAADSPVRMLLLGGAPLDGPRYVWWNFVSSSKERIERAKEDWREGRFPTIPGDDEERIPLPEGA